MQHGSLSWVTELTGGRLWFVALPFIFFIVLYIQVKCSQPILAININVVKRYTIQKFSLAGSGRPLDHADAANQ